MQYICTMPDSLHIADFLNPIRLAFISNDDPYHDGQIGRMITAYESEFPEVHDADVILVGCADQRGSGPFKASDSPDAVRRELFRMYHWHTSIKIVDIGNVKTGSSLEDSYAALKTICKEIGSINKPLVIIGGSHDLTLAQYYAFADQQRLIEAVCVDALIDLDMNSPSPADHFLMEILTGEPNFVRHYNHIGVIMCTRTCLKRSTNYASIVTG
jgi:formiminoglutamase